MADDIRQVTSPFPPEKGFSDSATGIAVGAHDLENTGKSVDTTVTLKAIARPNDHPPIDSRPVVLERPTTIILAFIFLLTGLSIVTLYYRAGTDYRFRVTDHYMYFTAQYVPSIIGTITVIAFRSLIQEFHRMNPYFCMADRTDRLRRGAPPPRCTGLRYFPEYFMRWSRGFTLFADITTIIISFLVPAKASLLSTQQQSDGTWAVVLHRLPAMFLICAYALMTVFVLAITNHLWKRQTGLKWYPAALADQLALFRNKKTLSYFALWETPDTDPEITDMNLRLGYWAPTRAGSVDKEEVWYGVGVIINDTEDQLSRLPTAPDETSGIPDKTSPNGLCNCGGKKCPDSPYKFGVLWLGETWFIVWSILITGSLGLCLYILATGLLYTGFSVAHHTSYSLLLYSFVFRFLPTALGGLLTQYFHRVDIRKCFTQSFTNMYVPPVSAQLPAPISAPVLEPGSASDTILLEYLTGLPLLVPLTAYRNKHYKVAWFSLVNTFSPLFPIVVGGIFTMVDTGTKVKVNIGLPSFSTSFIFLIVYAGSMFFVRPTDKRLLPRYFFTLTDLIVMCHESKFLWSEGFDISHRKTTREHMVSRIFLQEDKYVLGVYQGRDNQRHMGFDTAPPLEKDRQCKYGASKAEK
ncbi:hypothetical protein Q9L58_005910 [Maublancomyces gigas]|uniref:Uncharacterized protein n=1 Tax=Discina gigas TaxID=1032678 RepID=A0ABR3GHC6_9PEZI